MIADLVIGVDCSTTSVKAIAWTAGGAAAAQGRSSLAVSNPRPGWFEQAADAWWVATCEALRGLWDQIDPSRVAAIGISNQRETFGCFDAQGKSLRPGILWLDERAKKEVESLGALLGKDHIHDISGKPSDITPCLYRFAWLRDHEPEIFSQIAMIADVHAALVHRLTGEWATSVASADPMGALDMRTGEWSSELLAAIGMNASQFPRLARPGTVLGRVSSAAAGESGLPAGTPVVAGGGDGQAAGAGAHVDKRGRAYLNLGTAAVSGAFGADYQRDPAFRTMAAVAEGGYIFETCVRTGTFLINWLVTELFRGGAQADPAMFKALEAEAAATGVGAGGLVVVPYWSGCMTPYWDTSARGIIAGLSSSHRTGHVYRAMMEGIALEQVEATEKMVQVTGAPIDHYIAIGGGAASDLWCQIMADVTGRHVQRSATVEASSLGAGIAAAVGSGWFPSFAQACDAMCGDITRSFEPMARDAARYAELRGVYRDLWPAVSAWNKRLAAFGEACAEQSH